MIQMNLPNRERLTNLENNFMVVVEKDWGQRELESLGWTCTHCYI